MGRHQTIVKKILFLAGLAGLQACATGQASAAEERYRIDAQHTFAIFEYEHWGLSLQRGRFDNNSGLIRLDPASRAGAVDIEISAGSVSTGNALFDTVLRSAEFFDANRYPKITFRSNRLQFDKQRLVRIDGLLTIKGISRDVSLEMSRFDCRFMLLYGRRACGANGTAHLSRSDFDLGRYVPFVSDAVTLYISVEAILDAAGEQAAESRLEAGASAPTPPTPATPATPATAPSPGQ
jgi:polyisoprenoid-binding protein YceI